MRENWVYYCSECDALGHSVRHFAAKHINNHVNNMHEGRTVKRRFAGNSDLIQHIQDYKRSLTSKKSGKKLRRAMARRDPYPVERESNSIAQQSLCDLMHFNTPDHYRVNGAPPRFPIAHRPPLHSISLPALPIPTNNAILNAQAQSTPNLLGTERNRIQATISEEELHQRWAKLVNLGAMASLIRFRLKALMDAPGDKQQVSILDKTFTTFLGHAIELFSEEDPLPNRQLRDLASMVTTALSSGEKITLNIINKFKETAEVIQKDLMSKGCSNFLLLGFCLMGDLMLYKGNPRVFLNGMFFTLGLPASSRTYDCEQLFLVLNAWCKKYAVTLNDEILEAIKVNSPKILDMEVGSTP